MSKNEKTIRKINIAFATNRPGFYLYIRPLEIMKMIGFFKSLRQTRKYKVVDFGCGDGFLTKLIWDELPMKLRKNIELIGIDVNEKSLKEAKNTGLYKELIFNKGKERLAKSQFDIVFSNSVLEHVRDLDYELEHIASALKPGGQFVCTVMTNNWEKYLLTGKFFGAKGKQKMAKMQNHVYLLSGKEWGKAFAKQGFKVSKAVGYLDKKVSRLLEFSTLLNTPRLLTKKLFKRWVLLPKLKAKTFLLNKYYVKINSQETSLDKAGSIFFVMKKTTTKHAN